MLIHTLLCTRTRTHTFLFTDSQAHSLRTHIDRSGTPFLTHWQGGMNKTWSNCITPGIRKTFTYARHLRTQDVYVRKTFTYARRLRTRDVYVRKTFTYARRLRTQDVFPGQRWPRPHRSCTTAAPLLLRHCKISSLRGTHPEAVHAALPMPARVFVRLFSLRVLEY